MSNLATVIDALAPDASSPAFPYAHLSQITIPGLGTLTHEGPIINGQAMPGQWLLTDCTVGFGWEIREGNYQSGATLVPKGNPPTRVKYDVRIWAANDAKQYLALLGTMFKKPIVSVSGTQVSVSGANGTNVVNTGSVAAAILEAATFGIDDPSLRSVGITKVVLWSVTPLFNPLAKGNGAGPWTAQVEFLQSKPIGQADPMPDQTTPSPGPLNPSAYQNMQIAQAKMAADRAARQAALAQGMGL
jgi:hypothetical protein